MSRSKTRTQHSPRTALVTGANRGIGFEVCRQLARKGLRVVLSARTLDNAVPGAKSLTEEGLDVTPEWLDVAKPDSAEACAQRLRDAGRQIDVLINNAGVMPKGGVLSASSRSFQDAFNVNFFGVLRACRAFVPAMIRQGYGRIVNVSSEYGSLAEGLSGPAPYSLSKAALNALTLKLAAEVSGDIKVNAACPGWVRTRMGGSDATRSAEQGAETIVWLATLDPTGPHGGFHRDRHRIAW